MRILIKDPKRSLIILLPLSIDPREKARNEAALKTGSSVPPQRFEMKTLKVPNIDKVFPTNAEAQEVLSKVSEGCRANKKRREKEKAAQYQLSDLPGNGAEVVKKYFRIVQGLVKVYFSPDVSDDKKRRIVVRAKSLKTQILDPNQNHSSQVKNLLLPFTWQLQNLIARGH